MRWVSPSATPTTKIAAPTTDVAIRGGLGLSSGSGIGSGSAAAWDAESDQDSPVDPRKVGDLCSLFQYLCKKQCVVISWIRRPTGASSHIVSCRAVSCYILPYADMPSVVMSCHILTDHVLSFSALSRLSQKGVAGAHLHVFAGVGCMCRGAACVQGHNSDLSSFSGASELVVLSHSLPF